MDQRVGCPEPCPRQDTPPKQQRVISDFVRPTFARSAGGPLLLKMAVGPKHKTWGRRPPASLQAGRRGATTGFAPPVTAQRWTCIDHGAAEGALPAANIDALDFWLRWIRGSRIPVSHATKRSVRPSPPPVRPSYILFCRDAFEKTLSAIDYLLEDCRGKNYSAPA